MNGGRAFAKPLPFDLGSNGSMVRFGISTSDLTTAAGIGMKWFRNDVPWNINQSGSTPIEGLPGVYSATNITNVATVAAAVKSAGLNPLMVMTANQNPGMCPQLQTALVSGNVYTSINVGTSSYPSYPLPFAITSGDSIQLTNGPGGSTQTVIAAASMAAGASGSLSVTSFTANANYSVGAWVYDTAWVASTPQHFADMMAHLVSQSGLQGLHWELFNEPDGSSWGISPQLLTQTFQLAYPAMKSADPTCTVHFAPTENFNTLDSNQGINYINKCYTALPTVYNYYDVGSLHCYTPNSSYTANIAPNAVSAYGVPVWQGVAQFQHARLAAGDTKPLWITEFGFQTTDGPQAQWYQDLLVSLSGFDTLNNVPYSSYLKAVFNYAMENSGANWGIVGQPAVAVLTELVAGH